MTITARSSTASCGCSTAVRRGATCRDTTARWAQCRAGSIAGAGRVCGTACWKNRGAIRRIGRGRPRLRPTKLVGDKAYSSRSIRLALRKRGITPVIPTKANERRQPNFDREAYRQRNIVERMINRLKNFRRIATRYEKRAANYLAMIIIGAILLWI